MKYKDVWGTGPDKRPQPTYSNQGLIDSKKMIDNADYKETAR